MVPTNSEVSLLPEIVPMLCAFYLALPFLGGLLFSHWLGRRGPLVATLYFLALALGDFRLSFASDTPTLLTPPSGVMEMINAAWLPYLWVALAFIGAWGEHVWRMQMRYEMATAGSRIPEPKRVFWIQFNLKLWRNALLLIRPLS